MNEGPQWLEERRKGVGGSDIAAILGLSHWKTAFQVYQEKRKEVKDWGGNDQTDWGKRMEPALRQWYSDKTGRIVRLPDKIITNSKHPVLRASLDGLTDCQRVVEIKTARNGRGWGEPGTAEIPDIYSLQVQHYLATTEFKVADVVVSIAGGPPELYIVPEDKELQAMIIQAAEDFWKLVEAGTPPEVTTFADAVTKFGTRSDEGMVFAGEELVAVVDKLKLVKEGIGELEIQEEMLKAKVIIALGEAKGDTLISSDGTPLVTYKLAKGRKSFDSKTFEKQYPDLFIRFSKEGENTRRFLIKV
jgi:putative phage-type endonuclease